MMLINELKQMSVYLSICMYFCLSVCLSVNLCQGHKDILIIKNNEYIESYKCMYVRVFVYDVFKLHKDYICVKK